MPLRNFGGAGCVKVVSPSHLEVMRGSQLPVSALGGSMVPRCVLQLLFSENHKIAENSTTTKAREKNKHRFGILIILEFFGSMFD
jgi:hypothetical protein